MEFFQTHPTGRRPGGGSRTLLERLNVLSGLGVALDHPGKHCWEKGCLEYPAWPAVSANGIRASGRK